MSISANFPAVKPSILLDFANSQQLDPRVTFSRSTTAPYYDGKTSALAEQNLLLNSNVFNTTWVLSNLGTGGTAPTIATTTGTLPDGSTGTIYQLTFPTLTAGQASAIYQSITSAHGLTAWTGSVYAQIASGTATVYTVLEDSLAAPSGGNYVTATQALTTSWQRLTVSGSYTSGSGNAVLVIGFDGRISGQTNPSSLTVNLAFAQLEQRSSVTAYNATTTSALTNYIPQLLTAPINAPRFDFNPTTGESLGLLIEQSSTNLLLQSQFASVWTNTNTTSTQSANIAPDGTQTAIKLVENSGLAYHNIQQTVSASNPIVSVYAKAGERSQIAFFVGGASIGVGFNLLTGATTSISGYTAGSSTTSITAVGNGWYRCSMTFTGSVTFVQIGIGSGGAGNYTGDGYSGIYIWGAQLEALAFPTSYIPTTSAQVTRASDNASMTGTNFSSWYNIAQGTLYGEASSPLVSAGYALLAGIYDSNTVTNNVIDLYTRGGTTNSRINIALSGNNYTAYPAFFPPNSFTKLGFSFSSTTGIGVQAGGSAVTITYPYLPSTVNTLFIGQRYSGGLAINGWIKKLAYYPIAVTSAQLQALTGS